MVCGTFACRHLPGSGPKQKRALSTKLGYSMMAVSVGVFSMSIIQKKLSEAQDEGEERTISTVAIFGWALKHMCNGLPSPYLLELPPVLFALMAPSFGLVRIFAYGSACKLTAPIWHDMQCQAAPYQRPSQPCC